MSYSRCSALHPCVFALKTSASLHLKIGESGHFQLGGSDAGAVRTIPFWKAGQYHSPLSFDSKVFVRN